MPEVAFSCLVSHLVIWGASSEVHRFTDTSRHVLEILNKAGLGAIAETVVDRFVVPEFLLTLSFIKGFVLVCSGSHGT